MIDLSEGRVEAAKNMAWSGRLVQVNVEFRPRRQTDRSVELPDGATAGQLIEAVGEPVHVVVAVRGGIPIAEDTPLQDQETILLLSAASGG